MPSVQVFVDILKYIQAFIFCKQRRYCFINSAAAAILHHCQCCFSFCCIISSTGTDLITNKEEGHFSQWINLWGSDCHWTSNRSEWETVEQANQDSAVQFIAIGILFVLLVPPIINPIIINTQTNKPAFLLTEEAVWLLFWWVNVVASRSSSAVTSPPPLLLYIHHASLPPPLSSLLCRVNGWAAATLAQHINTCIRTLTLQPCKPSKATATLCMVPFCDTKVQQCKKE